jgi:hypothetical protein
VIIWEKELVDGLFGVDALVYRCSGCTDARDSRSGIAAHLDIVETLKPLLLGFLEVLFDAEGRFGVFAIKLFKAPLECLVVQSGRVCE